MKTPFKKILYKALKISGIILGSVLLLMFLLPILFPKTITNKIKQLANESINGKVEFSGTSLSFFKRFPELTLTLENFSLKGSAPFQQDTLVAAKDISFALDLTSLLRTKIQVSKIYLSNAFINIEVDSSGKANYNVYKAAKTDSTKVDTASASLGIEQIIIEKSHLVYDDLSIPTHIDGRDFNYKGSGDFSKNIFDLHSHLEVASTDFIYNNQTYVANEVINADLVTSINTKSLAFEFQKNDLKINKLPVQFKGRFAFLKDGYDMNFRFTSNQGDLSDIFTALPPEYVKWVANTDLNGTGSIQVALSGKYIAAKNIKPDFTFNMKVRNGYLDNNKAPSPVRDLYLDMNASIPNLNPDNLKFNIDSLHFRIDNDRFDSKFSIIGLKSPEIFMRVNTEIDLEKWNRAFGVKSVDLKGRYALHLLAQGKYTIGLQKRGLRHVDTVITSIPKFNLRSSFKGGYIKYAQLTEALKDIRFELDASCPDNNIKHASMQLTDLNASALNNFIKGYFKLSNETGLTMDGSLQSKFNLADLKKFYPLKDSVDVRGELSVDINTKGRYIPAKKVFPVTRATIDFTNGYIKTKYYPHPIEDLQVSANIVNTTGTLNGITVNIKPVSLKFEGQPFMVKANLKNFADLQYSVRSQGTIDVGRIYQVFAVKGSNVHGLIITNFSLKGKQSDAMAGHYDQLYNSGTMKVKDLTLTSDLFPKPFIIKSGLFSFNQDKMKFDSFVMDYGKSVIILDGTLTNVIGYALQPGSPLQGSLNLKSDLILADDFMAFADGPAPAAGPAQPVSQSTGVILVPTNLNITFTTDVKKVKYNGMDIDSVKGQMIIDNGQIILKQAGFTLIGAPVVMDATYGSTSPQKAYFDYHINAQNFDIKRAYNEIKLFHDMASSAKSVEGIVSLDYKLNGKLNSNMRPVYPTLKGGGVLTLKQIKLKGYKLLGAVGKQTGHDSLAKPADVSKVDIKTTIANNIITIQRTKMHIAGFRPRFEGQVDFNGKLNLQFRLGLPPLGIFGIPMTITGTQDNPKIQMGHGKKEDELKEESGDDQ